MTLNITYDYAEFRASVRRVVASPRIGWKPRPPCLLPGAAQA